MLEPRVSVQPILVCLQARWHLEVAAPAAQHCYTALHCGCNANGAMHCISQRKHCCASLGAAEMGVLGCSPEPFSFTHMGVILFLAVLGYF